MHKVASTPEHPEQAMVSGLAELCTSAGLAPSGVTGVFHGTTIATNAVLEHEGAVDNPFGSAIDPNPSADTCNGDSGADSSFACEANDGVEDVLSSLRG